MPTNALLTKRAWESLVSKLVEQNHNNISMVREYMCLPRCREQIAHSDECLNDSISFFFVWRPVSRRSFEPITKKREWFILLLQYWLLTFFLFSVKY